MFIVTRSFRDANHGTYSAGSEIDSIPDGADWLKAGFVEEIKPAKTAKKTTKTKAKTKK